MSYYRDPIAAAFGIPVPDPDHIVFSIKDAVRVAILVAEPKELILAKITRPDGGVTRYQATAAYWPDMARRITAAPVPITPYRYKRRSVTPSITKRLRSLNLEGVTL